MARRREMEQQWIPTPSHSSPRSRRHRISARRFLTFEVPLHASLAKEKGARASCRVEVPGLLCRAWLSAVSARMAAPPSESRQASAFSGSSTWRPSGGPQGPCWAQGEPPFAFPRHSRPLSALSTHGLNHRYPYSSSTVRNFRTAKAAASLCLASLFLLSRLGPQQPACGAFTQHVLRRAHSAPLVPPAPPVPPVPPVPPIPPVPAFLRPLRLPSQPLNSQRLPLRRRCDFRALRARIENA